LSDFLADFVGTVPGAFVAMAAGCGGAAVDAKPLLEPAPKLAPKPAAEHREFDAAMHLLNQQDRAAMVVAAMIEARVSLLTACSLLKTLTDERGLIAMTAAGFEILERYMAFSCGEAGLEGGLLYTIKASGKAGGTPIVVKFLVKTVEKVKKADGMGEFL